jgi:hypothetical protein
MCLNVAEEREKNEKYLQQHPEHVYINFLYNLNLILLPRFRNIFYATQMLIFDAFVTFIHKFKREERKNYSASEKERKS